MATRILLWFLIIGAVISAVRGSPAAEAVSSEAWAIMNLCAIAIFALGLWVMRNDQDKTKQ
jgi:hypothetical protein